VKALEPIWHGKTETATRVRGYIEKVLDWAKVAKYRQGDNPARWKGNLDQLLLRPSRVRKVKHHPALPYTEIGMFMTDLRSRDGIAARALELAILCAVRTGDIIGGNRENGEDKPPMRWSHVDLDAEQVWTIPSTKTDTEHRVPLSGPAVRLLKEVKALGLNGDVVFPGRAGEPLSNMAMEQVIKRMNADRTDCGEPRYVDPKQGNRDVVPHGFRSSFKDWAAEQTNFPREIVEKALAHAVSDETERAYQRGDMLARRRKLMEAWAANCAKPSVNQSAKVVALRA
jgi:integrase